MFIHLNPSSGMPIYRQLFTQLRQRIASGELAAAAQLPSVRELAAELKINPLTVAKVFQLLEAEGLVETRRGLGTYVADGNVTRSQKEKRELISHAVEQVVAEARHLKMDEDEIIKLVRRRFADTEPNEKG